MPGLIGKVKRAEDVTVKALDRLGDEITLEADGFLAVCLQHEIDHLDGILFIDHVPPGELFDEQTKEPVDLAELLKLSKENLIK